MTVVPGQRTTVAVPLWSFDPCFSLFPDFRLRAHTYDEMT
jgi:hypothetical protein